MGIKGYDLNYYLFIYQKYKKVFWGIIAFVFAVSFLVAVVLPPKYKSSATILIEEQQIPKNLVMTTVTGYVKERLQAITQQILSRQNLVRIIEEFNLYPEMRKRYTMDEVVERMRRDIELKIIEAEDDRPMWKRDETTVAFQLSFSYYDPELAQKVVSRLAQLYLEYNKRSREEQVRTAASFLEREREKVRRKLNELEKRLSEFKSKYFESLPEFAKINLEMLRRLERELSEINTQIRALREQKIKLEGQLIIVEPLAPVKDPNGWRPLTPAERLRMLEAQLISLKATLSPDHPDVKRLEKEVEALRAEVGQVDDPTYKLKLLELLKAELADKTARLGSEHPDVVALRKQVEKLEAEIQASAKIKKPDLDVVPDNPAFIRLTAEIASIESEIESLKQERERILKEIEEYKRRLKLTPLVEKEYSDLLREYENTNKIYDELTKRYMEAKMAEELEESHGAERFVLIEPPTIPEKPYAPKRTMIVLVGLVFGVVLAFAVVNILEHFDDTVYTVRDVEEAINRPVLVAITPCEEKKKNRKLFVLLLVVVAVAVFLLVVHLFMPLDVVFSKMVKKIMIPFTK